MVVHNLDITIILKHNYNGIKKLSSPVSFTDYAYGLLTFIIRIGN